MVTDTLKITDEILKITRHRDEVIKRLFSINDSIMIVLKDLQKRIGQLETYLFNRETCADCYGEGIKKADDGGCIDEWNCDTCNGKGYLVDGKPIDKWLEEHPKVLPRGE